MIHAPSVLALVYRNSSMSLNNLTKGHKEGNEADLIKCGCFFLMLGEFISEVQNQDFIA